MTHRSIVNESLVRPDELLNIKRPDLGIAWIWPRLRCRPSRIAHMLGATLVLVLALPSLCRPAER